MAVYGINYDERNEKDLGYKSVNISYDNLKKQKVFDLNKDKREIQGVYRQV